MMTVIIIIIISPIYIIISSLLITEYYFIVVLLFSTKIIVIVCALPSSRKGVSRLHVKSTALAFHRSCFENEVEKKLEKTTQV